MKKILCAVLLLAVMVGLCGLVTWRVDMVCSDAAALLKDAEEDCGQGRFQAAGEKVEQSRAVWEKHETLLGLALRHTESENVDNQYPSLLEACRLEDETEFLLRSQELSAVLRQLAHMEVPYLFNVL